LADSRILQIMIVDDQAVFRHALRALLKILPNLSIVGEANNGQDALELALTVKPDVVLMDINMPGMDGLEATNQLGKLLPETKVLVLTQHDSTQAVNAARAAGASGYLTKSDSRKLILALGALSQGIPYFPA